MNDDNAIASRSAILDLLGAVLSRKQPLDGALEQNTALRKLSPRDRGFARLVTATVLRRLGQLDDMISEVMERPLPRKAIVVRDILRMGACQIVFLGTPGHAAVDTAVTLTGNRGMDPYKKLVNAILRRLSREGVAMAKKQDAPYLNTPTWLWRSWAAAYGKPVARRIAEAHLGEPPLDISVKTDAALWAEKLSGRLLTSGSVRIDKITSVPDLPGFADGAWWVQDAAAAMPARLLGDVKGKTVIDLCAAPGGKTAQLAAGGANVVAVDRAAKRIARLNENMARLNLACTTVVADATTWTPDAPADAVLLDAPCTATGTIRRHPDIARLKSADDVEKLAATQSRLLEAAIAMVRPGGLVIYCTCSLQPAEGRDQIETLLGSKAPVRRVPVTPDEVGGDAALIDGNGDLQTLPCHQAREGGLDGFFASRLRRL